MSKITRTNVPAAFREPVKKAPRRKKGQPTRPKSASQVRRDMRAEVARIQGAPLHKTNLFKNEKHTCSAAVEWYTDRVVG